MEDPLRHEVTIPEDQKIFPMFSNGRFNHPWPVPFFLSKSQTFKWFFTKSHLDLPGNKEELDLTLPLRYENFPLEEEGIIWLGHSTVLLKLENFILIFDPVFSDRVPKHFGPKRYRPCPKTVDELPDLDAVLISHNHFDHLDADSLSAIANKYGSKVRFYCGKNEAPLLTKLGCGDVEDMNWFSSDILRKGDHSIQIFFTPSQHWTQRTLFDRNKTLWGSWCIIGKKRRFFFAGDTGYCNCFTEIGRLLGPFDLAAIPIGAYDPRWMMQPQHVDPYEAVKIHNDVRSKKSVGIHWGTFPLANEFYLAPKSLLKDAVFKAGCKTTDFVTISHGEFCPFPEP